LIIAKSMVLSESPWLDKPLITTRELRGRSEFAKNSFVVSFAAPTCREGSGLMLCDTIAASMPIGLMATACRRGKHIDTTRDDLAEEGVFLGNNLTNPTFWMYSF
jgi:hypothetical protein